MIDIENHDNLLTEKITSKLDGDPPIKMRERGLFRLQSD